MDTLGVLMGIIFILGFLTAFACNWICSWFERKRRGARKTAQKVAEAIPPLSIPQKLEFLIQHQLATAPSQLWMEPAIEVLKEAAKAGHISEVRVSKNDRFYDFSIQPRYTLPGTGNQAARVGQARHYRLYQSLVSDNFNFVAVTDQNEEVVATTDDASEIVDSVVSEIAFLTARFQLQCIADDRLATLLS